ncbi:hypothetical protein BDP27DRAFT_1430386 [Rhodocollybia butyracea]|uniref:Uncharacterized protein n=1 Tax=Rhodocollybia butyracea TaxID=206335 RepID=A0A9P5P796_9AGAR|nr:hypothetical protein BDP27DRAFT_1430386 [Rhodocollybia butyracea]
MIHTSTPLTKPRKLKDTTALKVEELLKGLSQVDRYAEANQEANKSLVMKKNTKTPKVGLFDITLASSDIFYRVQAQALESQVVLLFVGLVQDDEDKALALEHPVKYSPDLITHLKKLKLAYTTVTKEDCFLFNKTWTTKQVENKLKETLSRPMKYLLKGGHHDWGLLKVLKQSLLLVAETEPDRSTLWDNRGMRGRSWESWSVIIVSTSSLPLSIMNELSPEWMKHTKRVIREIGWDKDMFEMMFTFQDDGGSHSPSTDEDSDHNDVPSAHSDAPPPCKM